MARKKQVLAAVLSHMGCERLNNEDNFFFNGDYMPMDSMDRGARVSAEFVEGTQLYAVCDGMGGAQFGERASSMAVKKMASLLVKLDGGSPDQAVEAFCREVSGEVYKDGQERGAKYQGTTLAMVALRRDQAHVYNVGDSRVYLLREGKLEQLSQDHSEVFRMYQAGQITKEQARTHPRGNVITQFIGMAQDQTQEDFVYSRRLSLKKGDRLLLCSDGISDLMDDDELRQILKDSRQPADAAKELALKAMELSGKDNLTAIVLDMKRGYPGN